MRNHLFRATAVLAIAALPLTACGDDDGDDEGSDTTEATDGAVRVEARDSLSFAPEDLAAPAGAVTIELVNDGSLPHTFVIEDREGDLKLTVGGSGESDDGTITLEAGEYTFYCDVAGHRAGGMEGTLTVE